MRLRSRRPPLLALSLLAVSWGHMCVRGLCVIDLNPDHGNDLAGLRDHSARICRVARFAAILGCSFTYQSPAAVLHQRHNAEAAVSTLDWGQYIQLPENLLQHNCSAAGSQECWEWRPGNTTTFTAVTAVTAVTGSRPGDTAASRSADLGPLTPTSRTNRVTTMAAVTVADWRWLVQARATHDQERSLTIGRFDAGFYAPAAGSPPPAGTLPLRAYMAKLLSLANGTSLVLDRRTPVSGCDLVRDQHVLRHGQVVAQMAAKASKAVFGDDPFVVLLLRRGDRVREYPKCSKAVNVARAFTRISTKHYTANMRLYRSLTNHGDCVAPAGRQLPIAQGARLPEGHKSTGLKCANGNAVQKPPRSVLVCTNEADATYTETLVRELRGSFDRVVLEPEFKQHISPVDNYQFFSVLLQTVDSARWHLNFNPQFVQAVQSNRSLVAHRLGFDVGRLCPEGI